MSSGHGWFEIKTHGDVLFASLHGMWNRETDLEYLHSLDRAAEPLRAAPWGLIADMRDWDLLTEEGFSEGKDWIDVHFSRRNQVAECWIGHKNVYFNILQQFTDFDDAIDFTTTDDPGVAFDRMQAHELRIS